MSKEKLSFTLKVGVMMIPVEDQLEAQGLTIDPKQAALYNKLYESINMLHIHSGLTDLETSKVRGRVFKSLIKVVKK